MSRESNNHTIAIVGKPNVGKSSLFNRLIDRRFSIVHDQPGVTRDRLYEKIIWNGKRLKIIDTGGITLEKGDFIQEIRMQVEIALAEAEHLFFVVDGRSDLSADDHFIAQLLRKTRKKVYLIINKLDNNHPINSDHYTLGFNDFFAVSALHGEGLGSVLDLVTSRISKTSEKILQEQFSLAIIGKPNAGKSSLLNQVLKEQRSIVSNIPGTTRDSVESTFTYEEENYSIIDTAGIIRKSKIAQDVEKYALMRALNSLDEANLSLVIIDATEELSHFHARVIGYADEKNKPIIIVINKWDLIAKETLTMQKYERQMRAKMPFTVWMPFVFISALTGSRITKLLEVIKKVRHNLKRKIPQHIVNGVVLELQLMQKAPTFKGGQLQIAHAMQIKRFLPTFILFVNNPNYLHFSYKRYIENKFRENFDFLGCPLTFIFKKGT